MFLNPNFPLTNSVFRGIINLDKIQNEGADEDGHDEKT